MSLSIGELVGYIDLDTSSVEGAVGKFNGLLGKMTWGKIGAGAVGASAIAAGALYGIGSTFDDVADTIAVGTGKSGKALDDLTKLAEEAGTEIPDSFGDISPVLADISSRMGLTGDELKHLTEQFVEAGRLTGQVLDTKAITGSFNLFGLSGKQAAHAMDDLFTISQKTGVGINDLATTVATNAANLKQFGFSYQQSASMVGQLDKAGLDSNRTLATLSRAMVTFAKNGRDPQKALQGTIDKIGGFIKAGKDAKAIDVAGKVFGTRGASQFVAAIKSGKLNLDQLTKGTQNNSNAILKSSKQTADFSEKWQLFKNKALLELEPVATRVFAVMSRGMDFLSNHTSVVYGLVGGIAALTATIATVSAVTTTWAAISKVITAAQIVWTNAQWALNIAMEANPLGLIVLGVAALVAVIVLIATKTTWFQSIWAAVWGKIGGPVKAAVSAVSSAVSWVVNFIQSHWQLLVSIIGGPLVAAVILVVKHWDKIKAVTSAAIGAVVGFVKSLPGKAKAALSSLGSALMAPIRSAGDAALGVVRDKTGQIVSLIRGIPGKIRALGGLFGSAGKALLQQFIDGMKNAAGIIEGIAGNVWTAVKGLLNGALARIDSALTFTIHLPGPDLSINPPIPRLATGGRATSETLAVIGEGREPESVLPDSVLRGLLTRAHNAGRMSERANGTGRNAPLIGAVYQQPGEDYGVLSERMYYLTQTRG